MSILIFIAVIVLLIVVHELGHFIAAKWTRMRVDEFGIGFPPRAIVIAKKGDTLYTLNWLPFGGFVKIYGENKEQESDEFRSQTSENPSENPKSKNAFNDKPRLAQAFVLVAGVTMNMLLAYALITGALIAGTPRAISAEELAVARDTELMVARVLPGSPAELAGLSAGDSILSAEDGHYAFSSVDPAAFTEFVARGEGNATIALSIRRSSGEEETVFVRPEIGIIPSEVSRAALGVEVATVGVVPVSFWKALIEGAELTWGVTVLTAVGLYQFFSSVLTLSADLSQIAGPVGIAGVVGDASAQGIGHLLSIMAIISINLALINLIPVPALDGGRLLFVAVESIIRRPINASVSQIMNTIGFIFLILLMVVVTINDISRIIG